MSAERLTAIDRAFREFQIPDPSRERWNEQVAELAYQIRWVMRRHRDILPSRIGQLPVGRNALEFYDRSLAVLRARDLSDALSVAGLHLLWVIVNGFTLEEAPPELTEPIDEDVLPMVSRYFGSLANDRYPNLVALADQFKEVDMDQRFALLVELFTGGLATLADRSVGTASTSPGSR